MPRRTVGMGGRAGQALAFLTVSLIVIFSMMSLVVDLGLAYHARQRSQSAADSASLAAAGYALDHSFGGYNCGVSGLSCQAETACPGSPTTVPGNSIEAGCLYAARNGFTSSAQQKVTLEAGIGTSAPTAPGIVTRYWVTARVAQTRPTLFAGFLNANSITAGAQSTAAFAPNATCVYVLDPTSYGTLSGNGSATFNNKCGIMVNSSNTMAMVTSGADCIRATSIRIVGGFSDTSNCGLSPPPRVGVTPVSDPFALLAPPAVGSCTQKNYTTNVNRTINPGVYCAGIKVTGGTLTMSPGTYILNGGGLSVSSGANINGNGVTIYNTSAGYPYAPIDIRGGANLNLSAPTTGPLAAILFFTDRNITDLTDNVISGSSNSNFTGSLYFPTTPLKFTGNSSVTAYTIFVVWRLQLTGSADVNNDYSGLPNGSPTKVAALIE